MNKFSEFINELMIFTDIKPVIHLSSAKGYRARAEFGWNKGLYTMMADGKKYLWIDHQFLTQAFKK